MIDGFISEVSLAYVLL